MRVHESVPALVRDAATLAGAVIRDAIAARGRANVMFASGASQLEFLKLLVADSAIDWRAVTGFHMDEYVGLAADHPASFRRYMREHLSALVPLAAFHGLQGDAVDPAAEATRYAALLEGHPLDLCCLGIGENGHLAFNDPPSADFDDPLGVKLVRLDDACKAQQVRGGHFATLAEVPPVAMTVTIPALMRARAVLAVAPEARKARPVRDALLGPISPSCPASALRRCPQAVLLLDGASAALLGR
ncbi:MAG: glucosamine-6-phosphate deaminase [Myxococcaceae bacterium]|nr:glucosamine-6-phosphate deaminase [Myxococcaceae bacterium]